MLLPSLPFGPPSQPEAPTCILIDASSSAVDAVLQQLIDKTWCSLAYFSRKLTPTQQKYSTFDCELLAIYLAVKHFHYFVEGCYIVTDYKPLMYALQSRSTNHSPRQLDYISQFTSDIRHLSGCVNAAVDTLSHIEVSALAGSPSITPQNLAITQQEEDVADITGDISLDLPHVSILATEVTLLCDVTTGTLRPYMPQKLQRLIFDHLHGLFHPGIHATQRLIASSTSGPA